MKAEFDKEIDSLLRESARRGRGASGEHAAPGERAAPAAAPAAAHLDADEQSAYAEHALPAPARAYYAAHLADCDDCRRGVTRLALAAGMPAQLEPRETMTGQASAAPHAGWRERLGALLAPRAWRYAVPALALLLVGAVSLIVLTRKPREATSIARRNTSDAQQSRAAQEAETHHAPQNANAAPNAPGGDAGGLTAPPNANAPQAREEIAANSAPVVTAPQTSDTVGGGDDAAPPAPPAQTSTGAAVARDAADMPKPLPTPAPVSESVTVVSDQEAKGKRGENVAGLSKLEQRPGNFENRQYENRQREQTSGPSRNEQAQNRRADDSAYARDRDDKKDGDIAATTAARSPAAAAGTTANAPAAKRTRPTREAERNKEDDRPAEDSGRGARAMATTAGETRGVAGRKFRRQDGAWFDTAYRAGQSYTVVRRNSEQFRALVADEPELRRIAGALGGDVTVVWKGRAYRIK